MISHANNISKTIASIVNTSEIDLIQKITHYANDCKRIKVELEAIFTDDRKHLSKKLNFQGLNNKYARLQNDIEYRISQAFLHTTEIKRSKKEQISCVLARAIICEKVTIDILERIAEALEQLSNNSGFLRNSDQLKIERLNDIFKIGQEIDKIKGLGREAHLVIEDYCHFYDLVHHLLGEKAKLYGKRYKADIYLFQNEHYHVIHSHRKTKPN